MKKLLVVAGVLALSSAAQAQGPSGEGAQGLCPVVFPGLHWVMMYVPCKAADPDNGGGWGGIIPM